jgi:hypothetical protein
MADFNVRSDSVNVEQIMEQIRARIREKRGVEYTEAQIQELAAARLEKFIDPRNVGSDLLTEFHRVRTASDAPAPSDEVIDDSVLFETHRPWLRALRSLLRPILKLFLNTKALAALSLRAKAEVSRRSRDQLTFEMLHNMVVEMTRLSLEVKNLTMRVESMQSRLEFNERRARALESVVVYRPTETAPGDGAPAAAMPEPRTVTEFRPRSDAPQQADQVQPSSSAPAPGAPEGGGHRSRRRRRRRGRRGGGPPAPGMPSSGMPQSQPSDAEAPASQHDEPADTFAAPHEGDSDSEFDPQ